MGSYLSNLLLSLPRKLQKTQDKTQLLHYIYNGYLEKKVFTVVELEINPRCNQNCRYCPVSKIPRNSHVMHWELFTKIIDELSEIGFAGRLSLTRFSEPLLIKNLGKYVGYIKQKLPSSYLKMYTNGVLLDKDKYQWLKKIGVDSFVVTYHPFPKGSLLNNRGGLVDDVLTDVHKNGICPYYNKFSHHQLEIDPEGNVLLCCIQYDKNYGPVFGNLRDENIVDIWNKPSFKQVRKNISLGVFDFDICKKCGWGYLV